MGKRIVVINPNSTEDVTVEMDKAFNPFRALTDTSIVSITNPKGPPGIECQEHADRVAIQLIDLIRDNEAVEALVPTCIDLLSNTELKEKISNNIKQFAKPNAAMEIAQSILSSIE